MPGHSLAVANSPRGQAARWADDSPQPPVCGRESGEPACAFYSATFERLFRALVHPRATVRETACEAMGAPACVFEIAW